MTDYTEHLDGIEAQAATCGHTVIDRDGSEEACGRPATSWRWYQEVDHEDCLERACDLHENTGGVRLAQAEAFKREVLAELDDAPLGNIFMGQVIPVRRIRDIAARTAVMGALDRAHPVGLCQVAGVNIDRLTCEATDDGGYRCEVVGAHDEHSIGDHTIAHAHVGSGYTCAAVDEESRRG